MTLALFVKRGRTRFVYGLLCVFVLWEVLIRFVGGGGEVFQFFAAVADFLGFLRGVGFEFFCEFAVCRGDYARRHEAGVFRAVEADGCRRYSGGHLSYREERVHSVDRAAFYGDSDDGERRRGCYDAGERGGEAGYRYERLDAAGAGFFRVAFDVFGRAVGRRDGDLVFNAEFVEDGRSLLNDGDVRG